MNIDGVAEYLGVVVDSGRFVGDVHGRPRPGAHGGGERAQRRSVSYVLWGSPRRHRMACFCAAVSQSVREPSASSQLMPSRFFEIVDDLKGK